MGRKPAFIPRELRYLMNSIDIDSIALVSRGDLEDDDESEDDNDDDHDTDNGADTDDDEEESFGEEYDTEEATDNEGSQVLDSDFYYFLFIDSHLNG